MVCNPNVEKKKCFVEVNELYALAERLLNIEAGLNPSKILSKYMMVHI